MELRQSYIFPLLHFALRLLYDRAFGRGKHIIWVNQIFSLDDHRVSALRNGDEIALPQVEVL